jgi:predicted dehydrogenase
MKKESRILRVGVLGCGPISQLAHFDACRKSRNAELYAICDLADDLRDKMAAIHDPQVSYKNYDEMLADPKVEAVIIGVADQFHAPLARKAVAAGKHVLVEKPLGVSIEECEALRADLKKLIPASPLPPILSVRKWARCLPSRRGITIPLIVTR